MALSTNEVLVNIVTAANLAGIEQAKTSLLGFNASTLGLAAGLGILYAATKSAIDISEQTAQAESDLKNAIQDRNAMQKNASDPVAIGDAQKAEEHLAKAKQALGLEEDRLAGKRKLTKADMDELKIKNDAVTAAEQKLAQANAQVTESHQVQRYNAQVLQQQVTSFIDTNRDFTSSQTDIVEGFASFVREGIPATDVTKAMNAALDISIAEHIPLAQAIDLVQSAESGRATGLRKLVGIQLEQVSATATQAEKEKQAADNLKIISAAYAGARDNLTPFERKVNDLNNDWQKMANDYGPAVVVALDGVAGALDTVYQGMVQLGQNNAFWAQFSQGATDSAQAIESMVPGLKLLLQVIGAASQPGFMSRFGSLAGTNASAYGSLLGGGGGQVGGSGNIVINLGSGATAQYATARAIARNLGRLGST